VNAKRLPFALILVVAATGCGGAAPPPSAAPSTDVSAAPASVSAESAPTTTSPAKAKTAPDDKPAHAGTETSDVLVLYEADVVMGVDDDKVGLTLDRITDVAESVGGHLGGRKDQGVMVRVPSARFREALAKIGALGDITHEAVNAEDVSEEFHDAEVRLANLKSTQKRLQDLLGKSGTLADTLSIEHELERVSMDIDRIEGRMRYLREHTAFSTVTVALVARPKSQAVVAGGGKAPSSPRVMQLGAPWLDDIGLPKLVGNP
jgi:hypothetical protein